MTTSTITTMTSATTTMTSTTTYVGSGKSACVENGLVNCTWASWTPWGACSATCGGGTQLKSRYVEKTAQNGGIPCSGESVASAACEITLCDAINCTWSTWTTWGTCSATCGGGTQVRSRFIKETAQNGGTLCMGESAESQACGTSACGDGGKGLLNFIILYLDCR